jgi:hypothetical protein
MHLAVTVRATGTKPLRDSAGLHMNRAFLTLGECLRRLEIDVADARGTLATA